MRYNSSIFILLFGISILSSLCKNTDITAEEPTAIAPKVSPRTCHSTQSPVTGWKPIHRAFTEGGRDTIFEQNPKNREPTKKKESNLYRPN